MQTTEECLLMYRRTLRQLLCELGVPLNPAVDDQWILDRVGEQIHKVTKEKEMNKIDGPHPSHATRISDASSFDEVCKNCGATDNPLGLRSKTFWGKLAEPCPNPQGRK